MSVNWLLFKHILVYFHLICVYFGYFGLILYYLESMILVFIVVLISPQNKNYHIFLRVCAITFKENLVFSPRTMVLIKKYSIYCSFFKVHLPGLFWFYIGWFWSHLTGLFKYIIIIIIIMESAQCQIAALCKIKRVSI